MSGRLRKTPGPGGAHRRNLRVLVDMDGVTCDFEGYFLQQYKMKHPDEPFISLEDRSGFYVDQQYKNIKPELYDMCRCITESEGFFRNLPPIEGAVDAVKEMSGMENVDVFLCTSPLTSVPSSVQEKFEWVQEHFGRDWVQKLVITRDKTIVAGDILIDDRPKIRGVDRSPTWDHVLFTSCHNKNLSLARLQCARRLDNWTDDTWRQLVAEYVKRR